MEPNPYESPRTEQCSPVTSGTSLSGSTATFTVFTPEPHEVEVYFSHWSGLETVAVDGVERFRLRSPALWGQRRVPLGDGHELTFRFSAAVVPSYTKRASPPNRW